MVCKTPDDGEEVGVGRWEVQILENTQVSLLRIPSVSNYSNGFTMIFFFLAELSECIKSSYWKLNGVTRVMRSARLSLYDANRLAQVLKA